MITLKINNLEEITKSIYSDKLVKLFSQKEVEFLPNVWIYISDRVEFTVYGDEQKLVIELQNAKPKIKAGLKYVLNYQINITKIEIENKKILIYDGVPSILLEQG